MSRDFKIAFDVGAGGGLEIVEYEGCHSDFRPGTGPISPKHRGLKIWLWVRP